eukprot:5869539-Prymnesium_polylepis.1
MAVRARGVSADPPSVVSVLTNGCGVTRMGLPQCHVRSDDPLPEQVKPLCVVYWMLLESDLVVGGGYRSKVQSRRRL